MSTFKMIIWARMLPDRSPSAPQYSVLCQLYRETLASTLRRLRKRRRAQPQIRDMPGRCSATVAPASPVDVMEVEDVSSDDSEFMAVCTPGSTSAAAPTSCRPPPSAAPTQRLPSHPSSSWGSGGSHDSSSSSTSGATREACATAGGGTRPATRTATACAVSPTTAPQYGYYLHPSAPLPP